MKVQKQIDPSTKTLQVQIEYEDGYRSHFELTQEQMTCDPFCLVRAIDSAVWGYSQHLRDNIERELNAI